jgi:DNA-binding helix-hairpin-helix protein with protein kinase domain
MHASGFVIADLNEQNIMVGQDCQPIMIDCDSLMSTHDGRDTFGGPYRDEWLPPELIGEDLNVIQRTANHDNFSLAVMLFRILMMGRHPFAGRPVNGTPPDEPEAVKTHQFVYAGFSATMTPPDASPPFAIMPVTLQTMFVRAFGNEGRAQRPTAKEWEQKLGRLGRSLQACAAHPTQHVFSDHLAECPWCILAPKLDAFTAPKAQVAPGVMQARPLQTPVPVAALVPPPLQPRYPLLWRVKFRAQGVCLVISLLMLAGVSNLVASSI